ncbi:MAG: polysaccharide deacetylase [Clostridia bacterium]|nr:polysaccharide deacetylase [Clostridia bacterium]
MNRNFTAFCAATFACALILAFCGAIWTGSPSFSLADTNEKEIKTVYLTFDDGPSDRVTPKILDVLKEENVKATFFIIGNQAETRKYILKREAAEGHTIGVHSYSHKYKEIYASCDSLIKDIDKCNEVIKSVTGKYSKIYRFPGGSFGLSEKFISAVTEHGLRYIDWNASTRDAEICNAAPEQLLHAAVTTAASTDNIVLLAHDSTTKTATAEALRAIIRHFKAEGYEFSRF